AIGVTNYSVRHLKQLMKTCKIKPMINQVEFHPRLVQKELLEFCQKHGIVLQAYASLGSGDASQAESFFSFPPVKAAAKAHGKTGAQVLLRWAMQKGCHVVPKSVRPERMKENAGVFNFKLSSAEMKAIDALHTGTRYAWKGLDPDTVE
ncbi:ytbE, partial [Symbiodinium necroappetens]